MLVGIVLVGRLGIVFCTAFERIRRLRKSPKELSMLHGEMRVCANLRNPAQNFHKICAEKSQSPGSQDSLSLCEANLTVPRGDNPKSYIYIYIYIHVERERDV